MRWDVDKEFSKEVSNEVGKEVGKKISIEFSKEVGNVWCISVVHQINHSNHKHQSPGCVCEFIRKRSPHLPAGRICLVVGHPPEPQQRHVHHAATFGVFETKGVEFALVHTLQECKSVCGVVWVVKDEKAWLGRV